LLRLMILCQEQGMKQIKILYKEKLWGIQGKYTEFWEENLWGKWSLGRLSRRWEGNTTTISEENRLWGGWTSSGTCPMAGFVISSVEPSGSLTNRFNYFSQLLFFC